MTTNWPLGFAIAAGFIGFIAAWSYLGVLIGVA